MKPGGYKIETSEKNVTLAAKDASGLRYGFATLLQIIKPHETGVCVPQVQIADYSDSPYRGLLIDAARNWHDIGFLYDYIDACYFLKLTTLQIHFTDSESFTLPIDKYPNLATPGRHYTKEQIKSLAEYANDRGIELLPEIETPGHCAEFQRNYPEIFGHNDGIMAFHKKSLDALSDIFREICEMFPYSSNIHIGGDEAAIANWLNCGECKKYAESIGIELTEGEDRLNAERIYATFVSKAADMIFANGKVPIVWEGFSAAVNDMISKDIIVMSWENFYQSTHELLKSGFKIINCSWAPLYIVSPNRHWTPKEIFDWSIYDWKPTHPDSPFYPDGFTIEPTDKVLGGQLCAWGDSILSEDNLVEGEKVEQRLIIERLTGVAENTWNIKKRLSFETFAENAEALTNALSKVLRYSK
ncbi:hypothetical protein FACS1894219_12070 [Clostridia bacterium]|nr:hypothetical protein FACS1894219_12070 [Clostridia bacterium]